MSLAGSHTCTCISFLINWHRLSYCQFACPVLWKTQSVYYIRENRLLDSGFIVEKIVFLHTESWKKTKRLFPNFQRASHCHLQGNVRGLTSLIVWPRGATREEKYVGETSRTLGTRLKEHTTTKRQATSATAEHMRDSGHRIKMDNVRVIGRENNNYRRKIKAIQIYKRQPALNWDQGMEISAMKYVAPRGHTMSDVSPLTFPWRWQWDARRKFGNNLFVFFQDSVCRKTNFSSVLLVFLFGS